MRKNIVITVLVIAAVVQSVLLYRATQLSKQNTITRNAADSLAFAAETQYRRCHELSQQTAWLRRHLEKTISVLENKYNLEPMPVQLPGQNFELREDLKIHRPPRPAEPFAVPYQSLDYSVLIKDPNTLRTNIGLQRLAALMNLSSASASMANNSMETRIDNFYQQLQRLEPMLEQEN